MRTPAETAALEAEKAQIGYVDPPAELVPAKGPDYDSDAWDRLHAWFEENTKSPDDAVLVFFGEKTGRSLGDAYIFTDGWAKRRSQVDDDGHYVSYN